MNIIRDDSEYFLLIKSHPRGNGMDHNGPRNRIGFGYSWITGDTKLVCGERNDHRIKVELLHWTKDIEMEKL